MLFSWLRITSYVYTHTHTHSSIYTCINMTSCINEWQKEEREKKIKRILLNKRSSKRKRANEQDACYDAKKYHGNKMSVLFKQQNDRQFEQCLYAVSREQGTLSLSLASMYHMYNSNRSLFILGIYFDDDDDDDVDETEWDGMAWQ